MEELHLTWLLLLQFVEAEENTEVTSNGSKNVACLELARSGRGMEWEHRRKPRRMGDGQDLENLEFPAQNFKAYSRNKKPRSF